MEKIVTLLIIFIWSNFLSVDYVTGKSNGLTIKLIHRDSSESPFYNPSLTYTQRIEKLVAQSKAHIQHRSSLKYRNPNDLGSKVDAESATTFMAHIGVGTFQGRRFKSYYFHIDPGSTLSWIDCSYCKEPGNRCFRQIGEPFPDNTSSSSEKLMCNPPRGRPHGYIHPLCDPKTCMGKFCAYQLTYLDNSTSRGFLAKETFTFETTTETKREKVSNLVFGCGVDYRGISFGDTSNIAGLLGLGWGPRSFVNQLGRKSLGRFSYCLQRVHQQNISTFLHFGENIPKTRAIYRSLMRKYRGEDSYFLVLENITVAGKRLNIPESYFVRRKGIGGCVLDCGTSFSHIPTFVYAKMKQKLVAYFAKIPGFVAEEMPQFKLCYKIGEKEAFRHLPTIIFHIRGGDLVLQPESSFIMYESSDGKEYLCLAMFPEYGNDHVLTIGAYQQTNYRFVFYTKSKLLYFGPENCGQNA